MTKKSNLLLYFLIICLISIPCITYATTQDKLNEANQKVDELESQKAAVSSDLDAFNTQMGDLSNNIASIDAQIQEKQTNVDNLNSQLVILEEEKTEQYESMKKRIQYMYERNNTSILELYLSAQSLGDLLTKSEYVRSISEYDRNMLQKLQDNYTTQAEYRDTVAADMASLVTLREEAASKQSELNSLIATTKTQLDMSRTDLAAAEAKAKALEEQLENERIERERQQRIMEEEAARLAALANANNSGNTSSVTNGISTLPTTYTAAELDMMAAIIECESGGEPYEGKLAVGSTVLNRVNSSRFPNSISAVIYQSGQFSPVASGRFAMVMARGANASCYQAAREVLAGNLNVTALYFHVKRADDTIGTVIGAHIFY